MHCRAPQGHRGAARRGQRDSDPCDAVIVPLVAGPHQPTLNAITQAIQATGLQVRVTDPLGPHPMLAEALHLRLAEASYVRADRMRLISVMAPSDTMADGVLVGSVGGPDALNAAGVTAVLLAARLGITVLPAALDDPANLEQALQLAAGCRRGDRAQHHGAGDLPCRDQRSGGQARGPRQRSPGGEHHHRQDRGAALRRTAQHPGSGKAAHPGGPARTGGIAAPQGQLTASDAGFPAKQ